MCHPRLYIRKPVCVKGINVWVPLKILCGFFFLISLLFQVISHRPKWFKQCVLTFFFLYCTVFSYVWTLKVFIPKVNSCAAFHVILPFASIGFSLGQFNTLHPPIVTVLVFKVLTLSLKNKSQTSFQWSSLNSEEKCLAFEFQDCRSKSKVYHLNCTG